MQNGSGPTTNDDEEEEETMRFTTAAAVLVAVMAGGLSEHARAQAYPGKPVRMIISCPAGCLPDLLGRAVNQSASQAFGQPIVVENRPGANGNIAMDLCTKAPPDGYTICVVSSVAMSLNPFAYEKLPFDPQQLVPVIHLGNLDQAIAVHASVPVKSVRELVDMAQKDPGKVTWGSLGSGSTSHLYLEWMSARTGAKFLHVPYKGSPQAMTALTAGEVMLAVLTPGLFKPLVEAGKLRVIGIVSGDSRSPLMPDVPTLREQGFDLDFRNWFGMFFPKGTPAEPVRRWNSEVNRLLDDKAFTDRFFVPGGVTPTGGTPDELATIAKNSRQTGAELAKIAKLKFQ
jgi:tripartite-type tricarboxylate transporter receptor subunit TctC